jgi:fructose-bisphosphate aldolase class II
LLRRSPVFRNVSSRVFWTQCAADTQWSYWDGLRLFEKANHDYLQGQIGNPSGPDKPNKKYYDPRVWLRKAEEGLVARAMVSFEKLSSKSVYEPTPESDGRPQLGEPKKIPGGAIVLVAAGAVVGSAVTLLFKKK